MLNAILTAVLAGCAWVVDRHGQVQAMADTGDGRPVACIVV
jgi:hypothetical protein